MKKYLKILFLLLFVIIMSIVIIFYQRLSFYNVVDNTMNKKDKINYKTNIELISTYNGGSMKINYEVEKYSNIKKILLDSYVNEKTENNLLKYVVDNKTYVYDNGTYEEKEDNNDFDIKYNYLKDKLLSIKSKKGNKYVIKMNKYDAYNLIYNKEILKKENADGSVYINITVNEKNNFIEEISYEIDNLDIYNNKDNLSKYKVKITNTNINNIEKINLPFKKSE